MTDALKTIELARHFGTRVSGVVVNRKRGYKHETENSEIESMLGFPIISTIPEDLNVPKSIEAKTPVVLYRPNSKAAREFKNLASRLVGESISEIKNKSWFERIFNWLA